MNNDLFYKNIQPYIDLGMVREVHSTEHFTIISVGEIVYAVCPYALSEPNYTLGIYMNSKAIKMLMEKEDEIYPVINALFINIKEKEKLLMHFSSDRLSLWKKWIEDKKSINKMDYELERQLSELNNNKIL